jgi:hypothetical protein
MPAKFNREAAIAMTTLVQNVISEPAGRRAFAKDAHGAADAAGVDMSVLPQEVVDTLTGLSQAELRLLAELNETLTREGLYVEIDGTETCIFL